MGTKFTPESTGDPKMEWPQTSRPRLHHNKLLAETQLFSAVAVP